MKPPKNVYLYQTVIYGAATLFFLVAMLVTKNPLRERNALVMMVIFALLTLLNVVRLRKKKAREQAMKKTSKKD